MEFYKSTEVLIKSHWQVAASCGENFGQFTVGACHLYTVLIADIKFIGMLWCHVISWIFGHYSGRVNDFFFECSVIYVTYDILDSVCRDISLG
jgi:hypothetical protein